MQLTSRQQDIIGIITAQQQVPISKIKEQLRDEISMPTLIEKWHYWLQKTIF